MEKIKEIIDLCSHLSVTAPQLYEDKELRWLWYDAIDKFRKVLLKRIDKIIAEE